MLPQSILKIEFFYLFDMLYDDFHTIYVLNYPFLYYLITNESLKLRK